MNEFPVMLSAALIFSPGFFPISHRLYTITLAGSKPLMANWVKFSHKWGAIILFFSFIHKNLKLCPLYIYHSVRASFQQLVFWILSHGPNCQPFKPDFILVRKDKETKTGEGCEWSVFSVWRKPKKKTKTLNPPHKISAFSRCFEVMEKIFNDQTLSHLEDLTVSNYPDRVLRSQTAGSHCGSWSFQKQNESLQ